MLSEQDTGLLIRALRFAADKHRSQKRKDAGGTPYINHPIEILHLLYNEGDVRDKNTLIAGILHDTIEDTNTTHADLAKQFGKEIADIVQELSDDKSLPKDERKRLQIEHAKHISRSAQQIKIADKITNVNDVAHSPGVGWSLGRREEYIAWTEKVVANVRGANPKLEAFYDQKVQEARGILQKTKE